MSAAWPPLGYEQVAWDINPVTGMSRVEKQWIGRPYRAAVVSGNHAIAAYLRSKGGVDEDASVSTSPKEERRFGDAVEPAARLEAKQSI